MATDTGIFFEGEVYFAPAIGSTKWLSVGECDKFELPPSDTSIIKQLSKKPGQWGQVSDQVVNPGPSMINLAIQSWSRSNMTKALLGADSDINITGATVTSVNYNAALGYDVELAHRLLSAVVVEDVGAVTTYVEGTDYTVDLEKGFLNCLATGSITDDEVLEVSYAYGSSIGYEVAGNAATTVNLPILFLGRGRSAPHRKVKIYAPDALILPTNGIDFLGSEFTTIEFEVSLRIPDGWTTSYKYTEYVD